MRVVVLTNMFPSRMPGYGVFVQDQVDDLRRLGIDVEVIFLYPVAVHLKASGAFVLGEILVFVALLTVAFVFVWRRGALEWK